MNNNFSVDYAIKNFVWFLIFCFICALCIGKILYPQIESYKKQAIETKKATIANQQIQQDYDAITSQLKTLVVQNYNILSALHNQGDESKLQALLQEHFSDITIKAISNTKDLDIVDSRYQVTGYAQSTQAIEDFIIWANTMPYFTKIELPLKMEFDEASKHIYFVMMISLKNSAYKEHQIILDNQLRFDHFKPTTP